MQCLVRVCLVIVYIHIHTFNGLVLKRHDGKVIREHDLGPQRYHHHVRDILSETLYSGSLSSMTINVNGQDASENPLILPTDYGADPTGKIDSTYAFQTALKEALSRGDANVANNNTLSNGIKDCGGATIFLAGGDYLISETLVIPPYYGNIRITDGTLRANKNFSKNNYMIHIGGADESSCTTSQKSCNEYVNIDHFFCDCKNICYGCVHVISGMSTNIGPQAFFLGYNYAGVTATGGHSLFLLNSWFGEYLYSDPRKGNFKESTATSININNYDNLLNHVIVYSSRYGLNITDGASVLFNVHTWNLNTKAGGIGILLSAPARLINSYLDHNDLVLYTPIFTVSVENTKFLGGTLRLVTHNNNFKIGSLSVFDSIYNGGNGTISTIVLDESNGAFTDINNVFIKDTMIVGGGGYIEKSTRASKKLTQIMATKWIFDFSEQLLFGSSIGIEWIDYTFQFDVVNSNDKDGIIHWVNKPNGHSVTVETNKATNGTVYITVDQSKNNFVY